VTPASNTLRPIGSPPLRRLTKTLFRFLTAEDGPTAVEYAVMLALIVVVCVGIIKSLGTTISGTFSSVQSSLGS
jgi:pilus assembly protein Flp/PilA